jgi:hypothetical protein
MADLPELPRVTLAMCRSRPAQARMYLGVLLTYLKDADNAKDSDAMAATRVAREELVAETAEHLTDYEYALECAQACTAFLSNTAVRTEQVTRGFEFELADPDDPFAVTDDGKAQFMRPLAFASIFGVGWGTRRVIDEQRPARFLHSANPLTGDAFEYWGPELRQEDLSVLLWFAKKNEGRRPGARVDFDARDLLADVGRAIHGNNLKWLFGSAIPALERAHLVLFNTRTCKRRSYRLVTKSELPFELDADGQPTYSLRATRGWFELDRDYRVLLSLHEELKQTYLIDTDIRRRLASKPMALWLHMLTSSNFANPAARTPGQFTRDVATLKQWCYGDVQEVPEDKEFSRRLKEAARELKEAGALADFHIWRGKATFMAVKAEALPG